MRAVIYHNPKCGTSRKVLTRLGEAGLDVDVIDYLKEGWTRGQILGLLAAGGMTAGDILRKRGTPADDLGLDETSGEDELIAAMVAHPVLVERPIVCTSRGVALCRPAERVETLLPD